MFLKSLNAQRNCGLKLRQHKAICRGGEYAMFGNLTQQNIYFPQESFKKSWNIWSVTSPEWENNPHFSISMHMKAYATPLWMDLPFPRLNLPDSSMGSLSAAFLTWSDSPVSEDSSIFKSFPWINTPSAGRRSPVTGTAELSSYVQLLNLLK